MIKINSSSVTSGTALATRLEEVPRSVHYEILPENLGTHSVNDKIKRMQE